jgi:hypothetical protein
MIKQIVTKKKYFHHLNIMNNKRLQKFSLQDIPNEYRGVGKLVNNMRFEVFMAVMFQVEVPWVVTPPCDSSGLYLCRFLPYRPLHTEDGGSIDLLNFGILPQHYTASQSRRPRLINNGVRWLWNPNRFEPNP